MRSVKMAIVTFAMWALALIACATTVEKIPEYDKARAESARLEKPLIVLCGAEWCGPCKEVQKLYEQNLRARGAYVHIDIDRYPNFSQRLLLGDTRIPALIVWPRVNHAWGKARVYVWTPQIKLYIGGK